MDKNEKNNINEINNIDTSSEALMERLKKIKNNLNKKEEKEETIKADNKDIDKLKDKLKMDNAPSLKEVKDLNKSMQNIKSEFNEANNANISKEKFSNFISRANEMFKNYEKQLQYYSTYNEK